MPSVFVKVVVVSIESLNNSGIWISVTTEDYCWTMKRGTPNLNYARHVKKYTKEHNVSFVVVLVAMVRSKSSNKDAYAYLRKALTMSINDLTGGSLSTRNQWICIFFLLSVKGFFTDNV